MRVQPMDCEEQICKEQKRVEGAKGKKRHSDLSENGEGAGYQGIYSISDHVCRIVLLEALTWPIVF